MLYFSKLKLVTIYFIIVFLSLFSFVNFIDNEDNILLSKKVNLCLDLQGGSYLLLEVDSQPAVKQKLQNKLLNLRKALKDEKIKYKNLRIQNETINFQLSENDIKKFDDFFLIKKIPSMLIIIDTDLMKWIILLQIWVLTFPRKI